MLAARNADYLAEVQAEIEADGGRALAVPTNLVDAEQVAALVARTVDDVRPPRHPRQQRVPHGHDRSRSTRSTSSKWRKIFEVNVWGALGLTQACVPHLKKAAAEHGDASIVFIISMSMRKIRALEGGYSASKAAIQTAAKTMAVELGPTGVRVNCVAPGWIGGPNVETFIEMDVARRATSRPTSCAARSRRASRSGCIPPQDDIANSRRVLRVAVVARHHRPDARRQRR